MKYLVKGHPVVFDCLVILTSLEMDITHVDFELSSIIKHAVLGNNLYKMHFQNF